jgi:hypothetical protein
MIKMLALTLLASTFATLAVAQDGITYKPFIRGMERRGEPVWTAEFRGLQWPDGDETAFAGYAIEDGAVRPVTGP